MKSLLSAAGLASCCLVATLTVAEASELRLSEAELDRLTAAGLLFNVNPSFQPVGSQVATGLLNPAPPPPPPPPPAPPAPPGNQVTVSDGPASATVRIPTVPEGGSVSIAVNVFSGDGQATAGAATSGSINGGGETRFIGAGSSTSVFF